MRGVGAEVAAAVGAELLDGDLGRDHAARDRLRLAFDRRRRDGAAVGHRHALPHQQDGHQHRQRQQHPHAGPRAVAIEVADRREAVAGEPAEHGDTRGDARGGGHELEPHDHEELRERGQTRLAAVVLQVRVGGEARRRVEGQRRLHATDAVGIERQPCLHGQHREGEHPHHDVGREQADAVRTPVLLLGGHAGDAQHRALDRAEDGVEPGALVGEDLPEVPPERQARGDDDRDDREVDDDVVPHGDQKRSGRSMA